MATAYLVAPGTASQVSVTEPLPASATGSGLVAPCGVAETRRSADAEDHTPPTLACTRNSWGLPFDRPVAV